MTPKWSLLTLTPCGPALQKIASHPRIIASKVQLNLSKNKHMKASKQVWTEEDRETDTD